MSDLNNDLEAMVGQMGMSISEEPATNNEPAPATQETPVEPVETEPQQSQEPAQAEPQPAAAEPKEPQSSLNNDSDNKIDESVVLNYLSEKLGREITDLESLTSEKNTSAEIDESLLAINDFIKETGRGVEDYLAYQSMNPSEMDDLSAVKMQMKSQYTDLSEKDIELLIEDKYNLDEDLYDESEIRLAQIQLKMDADKARQEIESVRGKYKAPEQKQPQQTSEEEYESFVTEDWISNMSSEVDALEGIEFEVAKDKSFTFGIEDDYKSTLKSKNENIEDFFSSYTDNEGNWNFEKWNMHQAVLDNIETIVRSAYQQGLGEGQRGLVDKAANVQFNQPNQAGNTGQNQSKSLEEQVKQALGMNDNGLTFKI